MYYAWETKKMKTRDLNKELKDLGIISFETSGNIATQKDAFTALDAIRTHMSKHSDEEIHKTIEKLKAAKAARRYRNGGSE